MIRKAKLTDIKPIYDLLSDFADRGHLLARPLSLLYDDIRSFWVYADDVTDRLLGCCALQICWEELAEIRSLAVVPDHQGNHIGQKLVETALTDAVVFNVKKVFTLTYIPSYFERFGFFTIDKTELPLKIWSDCITCVKFPDCDETAMLRHIRAEDAPAPGPEKE
ncbi:MAG: N-acetyltransferase [Thermodesulfobacteriota bacterium]|nr:N-acetyltransferase [Thermodesulfobacteriota bacterium]